jgi:hypothetical protein
MNTENTDFFKGKIRRIRVPFFIRDCQFILTATTYKI